jgi:sulfatase maturation enzyme AslB (radical SAM superfamily)
VQLVQQIFVNQTSVSNVENRATYFELVVDDNTVYGGCPAWEKFRTEIIPLVLEASEKKSLSFSFQGGEPSYTMTTIQCTDADKFKDFLHFISKSENTNETISMICEEHTWKAKDCRHSKLTYDEWNALNIDGHSQYWTKGICIDCLDPCSQYTCTGTPGNTVLSPCSSNIQCGHNIGAFRILDIERSGKSGYVSLSFYMVVLYGGG